MHKREEFLQVYEAEELIDGSRKRKRCEEEILTIATTATNLEAGLVPSVFSSNYVVSTLLFV